MCILFLSISQHPKYPFIVASNRDEFFARPTTPAHLWTRDDGTPDDNLIWGGRDEVHGGTWLGIAKSGRFATITNYRPTKECPKLATPISRGHLVTDFAFGTDTPESYLTSLYNHAASYEGFNLLVADGTDVWYYSNRSGPPQKLAQGVYGLSNRLLDTPWPKLERGRSHFTKYVQGKIASNEDVNLVQLAELMRDDVKPPKEQLIETGLGEANEMLLASIFVITPFSYGTRCTSVITIDKDKQVRCLERTYDESGEFKDTQCEFAIKYIPSYS